MVLASMAALSCSFDKLPAAATPIAAPAPPLVPTPLPTNVPGVLSVVLPIDSSDLANTVFGLAPFGYHGADHAEDGHPGWDVEYRIGGVVRAAAAGTVMSVFPDPFTAGRTTVQIAHLVGTHHYRTVYTNLQSVHSDIIAEALIQAGQALGVAGSIFATVGTTPVSYAMTHFQLDDFESHIELPNQNAVSPEPFITAAGKALFDRMWATAVFGQEFVEPFPTNPRGLSFNMSRTWTRAGGDGPAGIRFTRRNARGSDYDYALLSESGTAIEAGTVTADFTARPFPTIDLIAPIGTRRGIYDIVSNEMRLTLGSPGESRPAALSSSHVYRTTR
jgi:hypothetical protein